MKTTLRVTATAADIAAGVLSTAASGLRGLAGADERSTSGNSDSAAEPKAVRVEPNIAGADKAPEKAAKGEPVTADGAADGEQTPGALDDTAAAPGSKGDAPSAGTRTRAAISNPKAARKVRQREQASS